MIYNEDDKDGLRRFMRQPSAEAGKTNGEQLGLRIKDMNGWENSETWVKKIVGLNWNDESPRRLTDIIWNDKKLAGDLDVSALTALYHLAVFDNRLSMLDVGTKKRLRWLDCWNNQLTALNVSACTSLWTLFCQENRLAELDVCANKELHYLHCSDNKLTVLDLSRNTALTSLQTERNQLTALRLNAKVDLHKLEISGNPLTESDVERLDCPLSADELPDELSPATPLSAFDEAAKKAKSNIIKTEEGIDNGVWFTVEEGRRLTHEAINKAREILKQRNASYNT